MSSLRDLYVGIHFKDEASKAIDKIDSKIDGVENAVIGLGGQLNNAESGFHSVGKAGIKSTSELEGGLNGAEKEVIGLNREVSTVENSLQSMEKQGIKTLGKVEDEIEDVEKEVNDLNRSIGDSKTSFEKMGRQGIQATDDVEKGLKDAEKEAKDFNREVRNSESAFSGLKKAALGLGGIIAGVFAVDKIKDFSVSAVEAAASTQALNSQFSQVFGDLEQKATANMNQIAQEVGMLPSRIQGSFTQMAAFAKTTGMETTDALSLTERATRAAADSAAFYDRSIEEVTENLQNFLKGNYENDAALGISATETTRNAAAMKLYGKEFNKLTEMQKQFTLLSMVEEGNKLSGALGQAARESDTFENQLGNARQAWSDFKATLATPILDYVTEGLGKLTVGIQNIDAEALGEKIKSGFEKIKSGFQTAKDIAIPTFSAIKTGLSWVKDNGPAIMTVTAGIVSGFVAFKTITAVSAGIQTLNAALVAYRTAGLAAAGAQLGLNTAMLASPITWVAVGIGALVAAGIALYKNWDVVKEKAIGLWQVIQENPILNFLTKPIQWTVMAGISLYQNFDTIKEKAGQLWQRLMDNPMLALVAGPIGGLIAAGITLYQNWDTIKLKAGELWTKTQEVFGGIYEWGSTKIQGVVGFFQNLYNKFTQFKDAISNFKPPEWVSKIGGAISSGISKVKSLVDGSHATGLAKVPFDGYRAELHKGEAVLTAQQSNTLRAAGILREKGDGTPELRIDSLQQPANTNNYNSSSSLDIGEAVLTAQQSNTLRSVGILKENSDGTPELNIDNKPSNNNVNEQIYNTTNDTDNNYSTSSFSVNVPVNVTINGTQSADVEKIIKILKSILPLEVRKIIENILIGEIEAMEG